MSKPAAKEPSMDEILSSIRQIIADDDAGVAPRRPSTANAAAAAAAPRPQPMMPPPAEAPQRMAAPAAPRPAPQPEAPARSAAAGMSWEDMLPATEAEPLALSPDQMLPPDDEPLSALNFSTFMADAADESEAPQSAMPELVDPDDIAFEMPEAMSAPAPAALADTEFEDLQPPRHSWMDPVAEQAEPEPEPAMAAADEWSFDPDPEPAPEPVVAIEPEMSFDPEPEPTPSPVFTPRASVAEAAPMPDPSLSTEMAEQLLEPATGAAVRHTFARLNQLHVGTPGITVEAMLREMLRPMLKEWLDENLPTMVERMVEREISRIARGE